MAADNAQGRGGRQAASLGALSKSLPPSSPRRQPLPGGHTCLGNSAQRLQAFAVPDEAWKKIEG
jgi:hypothetical protein